MIFESAHLQVKSRLKQGQAGNVLDRDCVLECQSLVLPVVSEASVGHGVLPSSSPLGRSKNSRHAEVWSVCCLVQASLTHSSVICTTGVTSFWSFPER